MNLVSKPKNVRIAIWLLIISIAIGVINSFFFNPQAEIQEHVMEMQKQLGQNLPNVNANAERAGAIGGRIGGYLGVIFMAILIYLVSIRKNWARIVMLIFTILGLISLPFSEALIFRINPEIGIVDGITYLLNIIAIILLFTPSVNHWFKNKNINLNT